MRHEMTSSTVNHGQPGIDVTCICGWISPGHSSARSAKDAFEEHALSAIGASKTGEGEDEDTY